MNDPENKQTARERTNNLAHNLPVFCWCYGLNNTKPIKLITYYLKNYKVYRLNKKFKSCQLAAPRQIHAEITYSRVDLLDLGVTHAWERPLRNPTRPSYESRVLLITAVLHGFMI